MELLTFPGNFSSTMGMMNGAHTEISMPRASRERKSPIKNCRIAFNSVVTGKALEALKCYTREPG